jgi:hypothetical protein
MQFMRYAKMFTKRFSDQELKSASDENIQLAYSNPAFDNIGLLCIDVEFPTGKRKRCPCGTAVSIGGRFLLTAAHCIRKTRETTTISCWGHSLIKPVEFTFQLINQDGSMHSEYKIEQEFIHPQYEPESFHYDLALLKLALKPVHLSGLPVVSESNIEHLGDCIATGFGMKGERDGWFMSRDGLKRAVQIPAVIKKDNSNYCNINGYEMNDSNDGWYLEKIHDGRLAKGVSLGMSGGALINDANQLLGITSHCFTPNNGLFCEFGPWERKTYKRSIWLGNTFRKISAVLSYMSSLPVPGLNPVTGLGTIWVNINCDLYRNWLLDTMKLNSSSKEFSELVQFYDEGDPV